jgi:outer membrane immunogenic protein
VAFSSIPGHTYNGWFVGGGTKISLSGFFGLPLPGLFLRSEYRFATYDTATLPVTFAPAPVQIGTETLKPFVQTVTTALVYRFNWLGR